jgi:aspartate racemase
MTTNSLNTIGVLGGMSSQSTIEYYRALDGRFNDHLGGHNAGNLLIRSVNFAEIEQYIHSDEWDAAGSYLSNAATELEAGGADVIIMATNTMHKIAPQISDAVSVPFLHIVDATADAVLDAQIDTVGVLGTETVMTDSFYRDRFADHGIDIVVPAAESRKEVDRIIFDELTKGEIRSESHDTYLAVIDELVRAGADGIVLGCTEIDLLVDQTDRPDVPLFDTTALHVKRAVEYVLDAN